MHRINEESIIKGYLQKCGKEKETVRCPGIGHSRTLLLPLSPKEQVERMVLAEPRAPMSLESWNRSHPPEAITIKCSDCQTVVVMQEGSLGSKAWDLSLLSCLCLPSAKPRQKWKGKGVPITQCIDVSLLGHRGGQTRSGRGRWARGEKLTRCLYVATHLQDEFTHLSHTRSWRAALFTSTPPFPCARCEAVHPPPPHSPLHSVKLPKSSWLLFPVLETLLPFPRQLILTFGVHVEHHLSERLSATGDRELDPGGWWWFCIKRSFRTIGRICIRCID